MNAQLAIGTEVTGYVHRNDGNHIHFKGTVREQYNADFGPLRQVPMVAVECEDGETRFAVRAHVEPVPAAEPEKAAEPTGTFTVFERAFLGGDWVGLRVSRLSYAAAKDRAYALVYTGSKNVMIFPEVDDKIPTLSRWDMVYMNSLGALPGAGANRRQGRPRGRPAGRRRLRRSGGRPARGQPVRRAQCDRRRGRPPVRPARRRPLHRRPLTIPKPPPGPGPRPASPRHPNPREDAT